MNRITKLRNGYKAGMNPLSNRRDGPIRYALVGLGNIAQVAVLPGFLNAKSNSELVAFVTDDPKKAKQLSRKYKVPHTYNYSQYRECLESGEVDAVYIALPNSMHHEFTVRAAEAGVHVLCEKPLAVDEIECEEMIQACDRNNVKLMAAYRLHFERCNLEAIQIVKSGQIGEPRYFNSTFSMQVKEGVRTRSEKGGGTLYDVGVYCINAARYLFQADPYMAFAFSSKGQDRRFTEIDEMTAATLRFPGKRLASFTCSFGAANTATYEVIGTKGTMRVVSGYEYSVPATIELKVGEKTTRRRFAKRDQFGPEIAYFSDCILTGRTPEPSGQEGLIDVHIVRSLYESACTGRAVELANFPRHPRPSLRQEIHFPAVKALLQIHTQSPHK